MSGTLREELDELDRALRDFKRAALRGVPFVGKRLQRWYLNREWRRDRDALVRGIVEATPHSPTDVRRALYLRSWDAEQAIQLLAVASAANLTPDGVIEAASAVKRVPWGPCLAAAGLRVDGEADLVTFRCELADGHDGDHASGDVGWEG